MAERQVTVRDRAAKGAFALRPLNIDVDPLTIAGTVRKRVDARLID